MTAPLHIKFWFIVGVALFFGMALLSKPESYYKAVKGDIDNVYMSYGEDGGAEVINDANSAFSAIFTKGVANKAVNTMHNTPNKESSVFGSAQKGAIISNTVLKTFKLEVYALFLRISIAARWIPVVGILGAAAFIDGQVARKIKIEGYGFTSPGMQARMVNIMVVLVGCSIIFMYMPFSLPIFWWPIVSLIDVVCIRFVSSNMKQITT